LQRVINEDSVGSVGRGKQSVSQGVAKETEDPEVVACSRCRGGLFPDFRLARSASIKLTTLLGAAFAAAMG
jgi:hypothetical protein